MPQKSSKEAENAPKRVWMMDVVRGYVEISDHIWWIHFGPGHEVQEHRINARSLWEQLKRAKEGEVIPAGGFDILPMRDERGVMILHIFDAEELEQRFPFGFQVTFLCVEEALTSFFKFCK